MITKLNPEVKRHIEEHINDIEQNKVVHSIICCPLDIIEDYVDALNQIGITLKFDYVDIATTLAKQLHKGRCVETNYRNGRQVYVFKFPFQLFDYPDLERRVNLLSNSQQAYCLERMDTDISLGTTTIEVTAINTSNFCF